MGFQSSSSLLISFISASHRGEIGENSRGASQVALSHGESELGSLHSLLPVISSSQYVVPSLLPFLLDVLAGI
ncbi:hypothetical protein HAX54_000572 [Datura stramonium]|uniref:Uncharacterized protein n=1 Tax=Datura stramonium TaxID=4076 RepID=A0ABS8T220_DATST|nr:hypothetical protein [Datura stramonium]